MNLKCSNQSFEHTKILMQVVTAQLIALFLIPSYLRVFCSYSCLGFLEEQLISS